MASATVPGFGEGDNAYTFDPVARKHRQLVEETAAEVAEEEEEEEEADAEEAEEEEEEEEEDGACPPEDTQSPTPLLEGTA